MAKTPLSTELVVDGQRADIKSSAINPGTHGLVVLQERLTDLQSDFIVLSHPLSGSFMNVNGAFGGSPTIVHDGTDTLAYTATNIIGTKMTPNSADRANSGSLSVLIDNPNINDVWEFITGSSPDLTAHTAISMAVNIDKDWTTGDSVELYGWDGLVELGNRVKIEDYFNEFEFDIWHPVIIPLTDMNLATETTLTGFRMQQVGKEGKAAKFYIDDFQIEQEGEPITFIATAPKIDKSFRVFKILLNFADDVSSIVTNGTMPGLSFDSILGLPSLSNGIVLSHIIGGKSSLQVPFTELGDFLSLGFELKSSISDGTNTFITLELDFIEPLIIKGSPDLNFISVTVRDDLTPLLQFRAFARGACEL